MTCYFIDTAHNVIAYIENISKILKPGGYWINLGKLNGIVGSLPTLFHGLDSRERRK